MRVAGPTFDHETLFAPATVVFAVGGTVLSLLILFLLCLPCTVSAGVLPDADLPRIQRSWLERREPGLVLAVAILELPRGGDWIVRGCRTSEADIESALANALEESRSWLQEPAIAVPAIRIRTDASLHHDTVRRAIRAAKQAGARHVDFIVLDPHGMYGLVFVDLDRPLPALPAHADAQTLVEAISRR